MQPQTSSPANARPALLVSVRSIQLQPGKFDDLIYELCIPEPPKRFTRLSEMLRQGYVVTAMTRHPSFNDVMLIALRPPENPENFFETIANMIGAAVHRR